MKKEEQEHIEQYKMEIKRVVITSIGSINAIGNNAEQTWESVIRGISGANPITRFNAEKFKTRFACEVKKYDSANHFDRRQLRNLDLYNQFAQIATKEAMEKSNIDISSLDLDRCGVIWGSGIGGLETFENQIEDYLKDTETPRFNPFFIPKMLADSAAGQISINYGFRGINYCPVAACASSTNALIEAYNNVKLGRADIIISGGSEAPITRAGIGGFGALKALSTRNDDIAKASRPFDPTRDGFVAGEGAACLIIESLDHALERGADIIVEIVGGGASADAYHITATHPDGRGAYMCMKKAIEEAEISPKDIDYINAHATSTPLGDVSEMKAIENLFEGSLDKLNISATKSMTGHLLGAAGAIEATMISFATKYNTIPPTINTETIDEAINPKLNLTLGKAEKKEVRYALSNTFGFGGHNASIIVKKYE